MQLSTRYGSTGVAALALLTAAHQLREKGWWALKPTGTYLLGVLPNFAGAIAITFVLLSIWSDQNREADFASAKRPFLVCVAISSLGLFAWELFQKTSNRLVFDPDDVAATVVGVGASCLLFSALTPRSKRRGDKTKGRFD